MAKAISTVHGIIWNILVPIGLVLLVWHNHGLIEQSFRDVLSMTSRIQSIKSSWMEVALRDRDNVTLSLARANVTYDDPAEQDRVAAAVARLSGLQLERLFTIDPSQLHCEFARPNLQMRAYAALDYELGTQGLISSTYDPDGSAAEAIKAHPDIGPSRGCHRLELTARGYNVKTAVIGIIREAFEGGTIRLVK